MILSSLKFAQRHVLPAVVFFGLAWALGQTGWVQRMENLTLDMRTKLRATLEPLEPSKEIAIIGIDEVSLKRLGRWPWSRAVHGDFTQLLNAAGAGVVTWDILFTEPSDQDGHLVKSLAGSEMISVFGALSADIREGEVPGGEQVTTSRAKPITRVTGDQKRILTSEAILLPVGPLAAVAEIGLVDTPPGPDGVRRVAPLVVRIGEQIFPSLSLRTLMGHWQVPVDKVEVRLGEAIVLETASGARRIPIDEAGAFLINYRHGWPESKPAHGGGEPEALITTDSAFTQIGYSELFVGLKKKLVEGIEVKPPELPPPDVTGKILLIGQVADGLSDFGPTPVSKLTPLVLVHANIIDNVLQGDFAREADPEWVLVGGVAFGLLGLIVFANRTLRELISFSVGVPVAYALAATGAWLSYSYWLPVVDPLLGFGMLQLFVVTRRLVREQRAKDQIKGMFGTYLAPELLTKMLGQKEGATVRSERRPVTILFSDLRDFTAWSERTKEDVLISQLNEYLAAMVDCIHANGGTLHKFIGDAVMAVWGDLVSESPQDDALRACRAALAMQARLDELNTAWTARGQDKLRMGIGLNHGTVLVGNIGSPRRMEFTVIGDPVNLASRLEGLNKEMRTTILVGESVQQLAGAQLDLRALGGVPVKGKSTAVGVFELLGVKNLSTSSSA